MLKRCQSQEATCVKKIGYKEIGERLRHLGIGQQIGERNGLKLGRERKNNVSSMSSLQYEARSRKKKLNPQAPWLHMPERALLARRKYSQFKVALPTPFKANTGRKLKLLWQTPRAMKAS